MVGGGKSEEVTRRGKIGVFAKYRPSPTPAFLGTANDWSLAPLLAIHSLIKAVLSILFTALATVVCRAIHLPPR